MQRVTQMSPSVAIPPPKPRIDWPIVLSSPVRAVLAGRVTQFREIQPTRGGKPLKASYRVGDVLLPREPWSRIVVLGREPKVIFRDSWTEADEADRKAKGLPRIEWESAEQMPDHAARCRLKITEIIEQRIQDATREDILAEGVHVDETGEGWFTDWGVGPLASYAEAHAAAWDAEMLRSRAGGLLMWSANPSTHVYRFELV